MEFLFSAHVLLSAVGVSVGGAMLVQSCLTVVLSSPLSPACVGCGVPR